MTGTFPIFDVIVLGCGVYLIWAAITMKKSRVIPGIMLSKGVEVPKNADKEGFLEATVEYGLRTHGEEFKKYLKKLVKSL